ncbi:putative MFS transporter [Mycetocola sp. CAN_C7]|uniref:MFS transporter n=1 Tax=Mycetocola sp. CAN_C7 TaxID=2787724 RepID=UPI0018C90848
MTTPVSTDIGPRLDRLPVSGVHRRLLAYIGAGAMLDSFDVYLAGGVTAAMRAEGFADVGNIATFMSMTFLGMLVGAALAGWSGDRFGRKTAYTWNLLLFGAASIAAAFAPNIEVLIICRLIMGIGLGAELVIAGGMLSEFLPPRIRGRWMTILGLMINSGLLIATGLGLIIIPAIGWQPMFAIAGVGAFIVWFLRRNVPESPRWLASVGRYQEADLIVTEFERRIAAKHGPLDAPSVTAPSIPAARAPFRDLFRGRMLRRVLLAVVCAVAINVCVYGFVSWIPTFFVEQGYTVVSSLGFTTFMAVGAPVGALIGYAVTDRLKRRTTLFVFAPIAIVVGLIYPNLTEFWAIALCGFVLVSCVYTMTAVVLYAYIPELFPTSLRLRGNSVSSVAARGAAIGTPYVIAALFGSFGVAGPIGLVVVVLVVMLITLVLVPVETSGASMDQAGTDQVPAPQAPEPTVAR